MKNKTVVFKKWPSSGCLDTHLAKNLNLGHGKLNKVMESHGIFKAQKSVNLGAMISKAWQQNSTDMVHSVTLYCLFLWRPYNELDHLRYLYLAPMPQTIPMDVRERVFKRNLNLIQDGKHVVILRPTLWLLHTVTVEAFNAAIRLHVYLRRPQSSFN